MGNGEATDIAYMVDQSHNLKGKIEAMIQTVTIAQQLFAKAALVDIENSPRLSRIVTLWARNPAAGRVCDRRSPGDTGMEIFKRTAQRSNGSISAERLPRAHHERARCEEC